MLYFLSFCFCTEGLVRSEQMKISLKAINATVGKLDECFVNATIKFSKSSVDVSGTGLWKLSIYGSKSLDGTGEQFQRFDQLLSTSQQAQPLKDNKELVFVNAKGKLDIRAIGCDMEFKYVCFEFAKGDNPNPDFNFTSYQVDSTRNVQCVHRCPQLEGKRYYISKMCTSIKATVSSR